MNANHEKPAVPHAAPFPAETAAHADAGIQIEACSAFERFVVQTRNSSYDLVVVSGRDGDVLIRGGRLFPEFRRGHLVGATLGRHTVKLLGMYVGMCLELFVDGKSVVTSPVLEILRMPTVAAAGEH